jgi:hypothetical protein
MRSPAVPSMAHSQRASARNQPWQVEWLERNGQQVKLLPLQVLYPGENDLWYTLQVREGQALDWFDRLFAVINSAEVLDELAQALAIDWERRW